LDSLLVQPVISDDCRRLIQFGLIYGLIRRLHRYPVRLPDHSQRQYRYNEATQAYNTTFCGRYCDDHVCSRSGWSFCKISLAYLLHAYLLHSSVFFKGS